MFGKAMLTRVGYIHQDFLYSIVNTDGTIDGFLMFRRCLVYTRPHNSLITNHNYAAAVLIAFWSLLVAMLYWWVLGEVVSRASLVWLPLSVA
jgi:hypothetical protein